MGTAMQFSGAEAMRQNPLLLTPEAGFEPAAIPGLRKAAILMVAIGDELAKTLFQSLSEIDVQRVTEAPEAMDTPSHDTVREFDRLVHIAATRPGPARMLPTSTANSADWLQHLPACRSLAKILSPLRLKVPSAEPPPGSAIALVHLF